MEARETIQANSTTERLKKEWRFQYNIEVMNKLNGRAIEWLKDSTK